MNQTKKIRFLLAKAGFDGHDRGAVVVATALRNAGIEVIYTGLYGSVDGILNAAIQEDVDAIGLSILNGQQMALMPELVKSARERGMEVPIFYGGCILPAERKELMALGVAEVFPPGTSTTQIVKQIREIVEASRVRLAH